MPFSGLGLTEATVQAAAPRVMCCELLPNPGNSLESSAPCRAYAAWWTSSTDGSREIDIICQAQPRPAGLPTPLTPDPPDSRPP